MRNLEEYVERCKKMLDAINIPYGNIKELRVNNRARRWGRCTGSSGNYTIEINATLLDERNPDTGLINTILHELLHSCPGCMNHGSKWKQYAAKVHNKYGILIKRNSSPDDKSIQVDSHNIKVKHKFVCNGCGATVVRMRESKFTRDCANFRCAKCGGQFTQIF